ncbi:uncharacterized protein J8A68_005840 [[Candida] subhashii]|uniref:Arrestin-like N-terminal domain-containing protein n=1 Tax=[Candida] subhashii TaxID=561895 RepID=A0A8J5UUE1_9ASCO|nr:uncharacterized protein J8A68_005840 [[Candida] subhashii]KAG7660574.1 hypothetical protein J8A68_005840 [[Candida] subhashii]
MAICDVKIEIDRHETDGTFTNHDIIRGTVTLVVTDSISLNYIQVKLEGLSSTQLTVSTSTNRKDRDRKDKILKDVHKVLYDTVIVFPPDNIRQVSSAKEFTLIPGNYSYPFQFKIPLNNSCVKMTGITNKISFNKKTFDVMINNGNFNPSLILNNAQKLIQNFTTPPPTGYSSSSSSLNPQSQSQQTTPYHITSQLPPSLSGNGEFASIKYYVKVTCKRASFLKTNLRAFDPFIFLPLDLDAHNRPLLGHSSYEEYKEVFVRKELTFRNRIPEIIGVRVPSPKSNPSSSSTTTKPTALPPKITNIQPKKPGLLQRLFDPNLAGSSSSSTSINNYKRSPSPPAQKKKENSYFPKVKAQDVPFSFEVRFRHPAFLIPTKPPSFKLFLVSKLNPDRFTLSEYNRPGESNGLGVVYLQKLQVDLTSTTIISVLESDGNTKEIHMGKNEEVINICSNNYKNSKFDLMNCKKNKTGISSTANNNSIYELEIPSAYFKNCILPDFLAPSFKTCNITRKYNLTITAGFSCEKIIDFTNLQEFNKKIKYVDLQCSNIKVLSGLNMTPTLHSNASSRTSSVPNIQPPPGKIPSPTTTSSPPSPYPIEKPPPPMPERPSSPLVSQQSSSSLVDEFGELGMGGGDELLPTYDDVMREATYQDDSEHQRARRRYQVHEQYYNNLD